MRSVLAAGDEPDPLLRDQIVAAVYRHLSLHYGDESAPAMHERKITLTLATLRRVFAHIDDHFGQTLRLDDLAAIARLSSDHFLRAFKAAVGQTPRGCGCSGGARRVNVV